MAYYFGGFFPEKWQPAGATIQGLPLDPENCFPRARPRDQDGDAMGLFVIAVPVPHVPIIGSRTTVPISENQPFLPTKAKINTFTVY